MDMTTAATEVCQSQTRSRVVKRHKPLCTEFATDVQSISIHIHDWTYKTDMVPCICVYVEQQDHW